jgi:hypothetical protein
VVNPLGHASIHHEPLEQAVPDGLAEDARWQAVEKIANSEGFRRSVRLREFLLYICAQYLSGHEEEITEQNIGHRIYHRRETYSPAEDNIVRVSARQLRLKLNEYYETCGKDSEWIVEVPKGGYVPLLRKRQTPALVSPLPQSIPGKSPRISYWVLILVIALAAGGIRWMISHHDQPQNQVSAYNLIATVFGQSRTSVQVVVSDPVLTISQSLENHDPDLTDYSRGLHRSLPARLATNADAARLWNAVVGRQLVNIADVQAALRFRDALATAPLSPAVIMRSAASMNAREFRSGNFILMGAADSNPWVKLFSDDHLNFRFASGGTDHPLSVIATDSRSGKQQRYSPQNGFGYARIALVPNLTDTGRILLIAGTSMESTESAANFCLDTQSSKALFAALRTNNPDKIPYFEALLQTNEASGTGLNARIVAIRLLKPVAD